jgi:hypothetical protein
VAAEEKVDLIGRWRPSDMASRHEYVRLTFLLLIGLATAITISATAYLCAWLTNRKAYVRTEEHKTTREELERLKTAIEAYRKKTGAWPEKLSDLSIVKEKQIRVGQEGEPVDAWGYPFLYRVQTWNNTFELLSSGPEHLPGGVGKNADMYAGKPDTWPEHPTLIQYSNLPETRVVQVACILAGVIAFPLCLLAARSEKGVRPSLARVLVRSAVTAVFAVFAALVMSALHMMPGGH